MILKKNRKPSSGNKNNNGFTLIELLVTISIMLVIAGGGIASFVSFNDKQKVQVTARELQTLLRSAQIKAKTGEGAKNCKTDYGSSGLFLRGYKVRNVGNDSLVMQRICAEKTAAGFPISGGIVEIFERDSKNLASGVEISDFDVEFQTLTGGVSITGGDSITIGTDVYITETITISGNGTNIFNFDITDNGEITIGEFE